MKKSVFNRVKYLYQIVTQSLLGGSDAFRCAGNGHGTAHPYGSVVRQMTGREVEDDGEVVFRAALCDNLFSGVAEGDGIVVHVVKMADEETSETLQLSGTFQIVHHPVNMVKVFIQIFDEEDFAFRVEV